MSTFQNTQSRKSGRSSLNTVSAIDPRNTLASFTYTDKEKNTFLTIDAMKDIFLMLCRDQKRQPNFSKFYRIPPTVTQVRLPAANEFITECVHMSETYRSKYAKAAS